ncbi:hypothetical protein NMY22_g11049 [Coprinellus aureogranulatus]|nr:hypothetical protein NMY22_g11049 [Coprinellus aureogranulatus]
MRLLTFATSMCLVASTVIAAPIYPRGYIPQSSTVLPREEVPPDNSDFARVLANSDVRPTPDLEESFRDDFTDVDPRSEQSASVPWYQESLLLRTRSLYLPSENSELGYKRGSSAFHGDDPALWTVHSGVETDMSYCRGPPPQMPVAENIGPKLSREQLDAFLVESTRMTVTQQVRHELYTQRERKLMLHDRLKPTASRGPNILCLLLAGQSRRRSGQDLEGPVENGKSPLPSHDIYSLASWVCGPTKSNNAVPSIVSGASLFPTQSRTVFNRLRSQDCWNFVIAVQVLNYIQTYAPAGLISQTPTDGLTAVFLGICRDHDRSVPIRTAGQDKYVFNTVLTYANVAREATVLIFGGWVVFTRYRRQNDALIRAIRRDGGAYLVAAFLLGAVSAVLRTPKFPIDDRYSVITETRLVVYPILANRLLLNLRDTTDYTTRTAVSNILFDSSRFDALNNDDEVLEEVFRSGPRAVSGDGLVEGEGADPEIGEDMPQPTSAMASGRENRMPLSSRHNGSIV